MDKKKQYWILVASKDHVFNGVKAGIAQACHGKAYPLKRMNVGDGIIYYSPKLEYGKVCICQEFTAVGEVSGTDVYLYDMGNGFIPYRRKIRYFASKPISIKALVEKLEFITDIKHWGYKFRFGAFEIPEVDFNLISNEMLEK